MPAEVIWPLLLLLTGLLCGKRALSLSKPQILLLLACGGVVAIQIAVFGVHIAASAFGFLVMLAATVCGVRAIDDFSRRYVDLMVIIAATSMVFYFLRLGGVIHSSDFSWMPAAQLENGWIHAWVFNFQKESEAFRNSGPFWEPGAFAGYLGLALLLLVLRGGLKPMQVGILLAALLTTMSTTGFIIILPLALLILNQKKGQPRHPVWIFGVLTLGMVMVLAFGSAFRSIPFLAEKIDHQAAAARLGLKGNEITRFGSAIYDLGFVKDSPLIGWSADPSTRVRVDPVFDEIVKGQGNGLTGFAAKYGVPLLILYLALVYSSLRRLAGSSRLSLLGVGTVVLMLFGEQFLNFPIFWAIALACSAGYQSVPLRYFRVTDAGRYEGHRSGDSPKPPVYPWCLQHKEQSNVEFR